jgi:hypothetical protein
VSRRNYLRAIVDGDSVDQAGYERLTEWAKKGVDKEETRLARRRQEAKPLAQQEADFLADLRRKSAAYKAEYAACVAARLEIGMLGQSFTERYEAGRGGAGLFGKPDLFGMYDFLRQVRCEKLLTDGVEPEIVEWGRKAFNYFDFMALTADDCEEHGYALFRLCFNSRGRDGVVRRIVGNAGRRGSALVEPVSDRPGTPRLSGGSSEYFKAGGRS